MMNGYNYDAMNNTLTISESFAKKASKFGTPEYNVIRNLHKDFPNLTIKKEEKKEGKKSITFAQMETFINGHRNKGELMNLYNNVKKLSRVQPMPYRYVKTWFENRFPYYSEQPVFDSEGYIVDPVTLRGMQEMYKEVIAANQPDNVIPMEQEEKTAA